MMLENVELQQFMIDKQAELAQQYRKVELVSFTSVTLIGHLVSEKFTATNTPLIQLGHEVMRGEFPVLTDTESVLGVKENGTQVVFHVTPKGKRKPERKEFYFLWL